MANYPLAFGELLAGAILIDYGVKAFQGGLSAAGAAGGGTTAPAGGVGSATLPAGASKRLNASQQTFVARLAADTGLDAGVVAAWVVLEEGGQSVAPNGANNWLNIGATDSGFFGAGNAAWKDPTTAADQTAQWLAGSSASGFGKASAGIRNILRTAGQPASAQIAAIQGSGWASSGYPDFGQVYHQIVG
jgi:hypothetical protein